MQRQVPASTSTTAGICEKNRLVFNPWSKKWCHPFLRQRGSANWQIQRPWNGQEIGALWQQKHKEYHSLPFFANKLSEAALSDTYRGTQSWNVGKGSRLLSLLALTSTVSNINESGDKITCFLTSLCDLTIPFPSHLRNVPAPFSTPLPTDYLGFLGLVTKVGLRRPMGRHSLPLVTHWMLSQVP